MNDRETRIVIRWRTRGQAEALGPALDQAYPIDEAAPFNDAIEAIDEAERQVWGNPDHSAKTPD